MIWRATGGEVPPGARYYRQGYVYEELGPRKVVGKGKDKTDAWEKKAYGGENGGVMSIQKING